MKSCTMLATMIMKFQAVMTDHQRPEILLKKSESIQCDYKNIIIKTEDILKLK